MNILKQFNQKGKTIIMVSHDEEIINECSKGVELS